MENTNSTLEHSLSRILAFAAAACALFFLAAYLIAAFGRMRYPFELEWIEGAMVEQVARITAGQPVYGPPSVHFVPFLYTPLYFYLSASAAWIFGDGFLPLRLVSILASLGIFALAFALVREETNSALASLMAAGLFAACYRIAGSWLDIGRTDSVFLFFILWFLYLSRNLQSIPRAVLAGLAASLAYLTKQTSVFLLAPVLLCLLLTYWRRAWITALVAAATLGGATLLLQETTGGWYMYYTFDLLWQQTAWGAVSIQDFFLFDVLARLPIVVFAGMFLLWTEAFRDRKRFLFWAAALAGAIAAALISRMKAGGFDNVLLPAYLLLAILAGLAWGRMAERLRDPSPLSASLRAAGSLLLLTQFAMLIYNPLHQIPSAAEEAQQRYFLQYVVEIPGEVYIPYHGYISRLAGKSSFAHQSAVWDVLRGDPQNAGTLALKESLAHAIESKEFRAIILDGDWNYLSNLDRFYQRKPEGFPQEVAFKDRVGWPVSPTDIFLPNP
jgi:hypothetical protein